MTDSGAKATFLADAMLIRLARWLRVLNYDTLCHPEKPDAQLIALADAEERWLLTRDKKLIGELHPKKFILVSSSRPLEQLTHIVQVCHLTKPDKLFSRCMLCNTPVRHLTRNEIETSTLPAATSFTLYRTCPDCGRLYWPGSHTRRMKADLRRAFPYWF